MSASESEALANLEVDVDAAFTRLRQLKGQLRRQTKHDQVAMLIAAAIEEGFVGGKRITGTIYHLGYDRQFVCMVLTQQAGMGDGHLWSKVDGTYRLNA